jgi:hypothetical protein
MPQKIRKAAVKIMSLENMKVISLYTTKEAVADGMLIRVADADSQEAGIKYPVYLSRQVWQKYVKVPAAYTNEQDEKGRVWDILWMFMHAAKSCKSSCLEYHFICHIPNSGNWEAHESHTGADLTYRLVKLKATIQAQDFDDPNPAIFILKPQED